MDQEFFQEGETILRQGNTGNNFYIIIEGEVAVYKMCSTENKNSEVSMNNKKFNEYYNENEYERLAVLKKGQYFGEKALLKEDVRDASCVAQTNVTCLTLGREEFIQMIGRLEDMVNTSEHPKLRSLTFLVNINNSSNVFEMEGNDRSKNNLPLSTDFNLKDLDILNTIGQGAFGKVKICLYNPTKEKFALKMQSKKVIIENNMKDHILDEFHLMRAVNHPYIAKVFAVMQDNSYIYYLMEYLSGGEFFTYLQDFERISEQDAKYYAAVITNAFQSLHHPSLKIAYRDLKPENIVCLYYL
jgi:hypothetical protein